jgi:hypothetical protein
MYGIGLSYGMYGLGFDPSFKLEEDNVSDRHDQLHQEYSVLYNWKTVDEE